MPDEKIADGDHDTRNRKSNDVESNLRLDFVPCCWQEIALTLHTIVSKRSHLLNELLN